MVYKKLDISRCQGRFFGAPPKPRTQREAAGVLVVNTLNRKVEVAPWAPVPPPRKRLAAPGQLGN
jgi:hypothetical protein